MVQVVTKSLKGFYVKAADKIYSTLFCNRYIQDTQHIIQSVNVFYKPNKSVSTHAFCIVLWYETTGNQVVYLISEEILNKVKFAVH